VHKLGDKIEVFTKAENHKTYRIFIDWEQVLKEKYMEDISIEISEVPNIPEISISGTIIKISKLKSTWSEREVVGLYNDVSSIQSPFDIPKDLLGAIEGSFKTVFRVPTNPEWLENQLDINEVLYHSFYKYDFTVRNGKISYNYEFTPPPAIRSRGIEPNKIIIKNENLPVNRNQQGSKTLEKEDLEGIGTIHGTFYVFAFDSEIASIIGDDIRKVKRYLKDQGGIRVYRDGVRVYNYGEAGDDWLGLDAKRVKRFATGINRSLILGVVDLSLENSYGLIEKTNREGFVENTEYENLKLVVSAAISSLTSERYRDKERMHKILSGETRSSVNPAKPMQQLMAELQQIPGTDKCIEYLTEAQKDMETIRDTMVESGSKGLFISLIYHELEKFIDHFIKAFHRVESLSKEEIKRHYEEARRVAEMMQSFKTVTKKASIKENSLNKNVDQVLKLLNSRISYHNITVKSTFSEKEDIKCVFSTSSLTSAIINIIDNSIYWLQVRWSGKKDNRKIYIGTTDYYGSPALVIADNGPGFKGDPADLVQAFVSLKPDGVGMGLGLYYTQLVMDMTQGNLVLENAAHLDFIPEEYDGAAVILVFNNEVV